MEKIPFNVANHLAVQYTDMPVVISTVIQFYYHHLFSVGQRRLFHLQSSGAVQGPCLTVTLRTPLWTGDGRAVGSIGDDGEEPQKT